MRVAAAACFALVALLAAARAGAACPALLDRKMETLAGEEQSLCRYAGKVLLVVNTASRCGYTPQYDGLEKLYRRYQAQGLVVLGFPSNDFGAQEPGSAAEIADFCRQNYGVSFPMFAKTGVRAGAANPFYEGLAKASGSTPQWNFHKYLVDRRAGKVLPFGTRVAPQDRQLVGEIERLLAER